MHANLIHLGHLHIPVFSAFVVVGLIVALLLSQRTAPLAGLAAETMWDAGVIAALSVFLISRLLLVAFNFKSFLAYPLLVLSLPSVTFTGILASGIVMSAYLRYRRVPAVLFLDAAAPCLALLWAILSLGASAGGSKGMPMTHFWAVQDALLGPVHPVEVYSAVCFATLALLLLSGLAIMQRRQGRPGAVAATALFVSGTLVFLLDFFAQPSALSSYILFDPAEWVGLLLIVLGVMMAMPHIVSESQPGPQESKPHAV